MSATAASAATTPAPLEAAPSLTSPHLRECPGCGLFQLLPAMTPGTVARCPRCETVLRRTRGDPLCAPLAWTMCGLVLFAIASTMTLVVLDSGTEKVRAGLLSGPQDLGHEGLWFVAIAVLLTSFVAPLVKLSGMIYVLGGLRLPRPPRHIRRVFAWMQRLRPWSMIEVYILGIMIAYVKMVDLAKVEIGPGLYALGGVMLAMAAADATMDFDAVWEEMSRRGVADADELSLRVDPTSAGIQGAIGCDCCGLVSLPQPGRPHCARCGAELEHRKAESLQRTWAYLLASMTMYAPANIFPVMTIVSFGVGEPSTILGGVKELIESNMYPLAAVVFFASITVPVLKMIGLILLLVSTKAGWRGRLRDRTRLYHIVDMVGRWSMIDVFTISILVALVQFGNLFTIESGFGIVAFAMVVILTMFAAEAFDPRLMWDNAGQNDAWGTAPGGGHE